MATDKTFPSDSADKYVVRLPEGMRDRIAEAAKASGRSMNSEIVTRLEQSFDGAAISTDVAYTLTKLSAQVVAADLMASGLQMQAGTLAHLLTLAIECVEAGKPLPAVFDGWEELTSAAINQSETANKTFEGKMEEFRAHTAKLMSAREDVGLSNDTGSPWTDPQPAPAPSAPVAEVQPAPHRKQARRFVVNRTKP